MSIVIDARLAGVDQRGIGRYSEEMLKMLDRQENARAFTCFVSESSLPELRKTMPHLTFVGFRGRWYSLFAEQIRFTAAVLAHEPRFVYFFHCNVPVLLAVALWCLDIPWVVTIHDLTLLRRGPERASTTRWYPLYWLKFQGFRAVLSVVARLATHLVAVSEATRNDIIRFFPKTAGRVSVILEGTEHIGRVLPSVREAARTRARMSTSMPYILYVGSAYPHKQLPVLIEAFCLFVRDVGSPELPYSLVILGKPDRFRQRLVAWTRAIHPSARVFFVGGLGDEQLVSWYAGASAVALPSSEEGFGLPMAEAFAVGTPVVASDIPPLKEMGTGAAIFFKAGDAPSAASALRTMCEDSQDSRRRRADCIFHGQARAAGLLWQDAASGMVGLIESRHGAHEADRGWATVGLSVMWLALFIEGVFAAAFLSGSATRIWFALFVCVVAFVARQASSVFERWMLLAASTLFTVFLFSVAITFLSVPPIVAYTVELPLLLLFGNIAAPPLSRARSMSQMTISVCMLVCWQFSLAALWIPMSLSARAVLVVLLTALCCGNSVGKIQKWPWIYAAMGAISLLLLGSSYVLR